MGSLAATRGLPRFLLAPATALAVGALEGGWHALTCQLYLFAETSKQVLCIECVSGCVWREGGVRACA